MVKTCGMIVAFIVAASCVLSAEEPRETKAVAKEVTARIEGLETVEGEVESVVLADLLTRPQSKIGIIDRSGKELVFVVKPAAMIYDHEGAIISLFTIGIKRSVQVSYRVARDGTLEASVIKLVRQDVPSPGIAERNEEAPKDAVAPLAPAEQSVEEK